MALEGACLSLARARQACLQRGAILERGPAEPASPEGSAACVPLRCPPGELPDEMTGACLGAGVLRSIASRRGVTVRDDETLGCSGGGRLRVAWGLPFCLPKDESCAPVEEMRGEQCVVRPTCAPGYMLEPKTSRCLRLMVAGRDVPTFDVATWARSALGPDGGEGAHALCAMMTRDASGFDAPPSERWRVSIELTFPNNEITAAQLGVRVSGERGDGVRAPPWLVASATRASQAIVDGLRALGGSASAARIDLTVWCSVRHGAPPVALSLQEAASTERAAGTIK